MLLLERLHPSIMVMLSQIKLQSLSQHNEFTVNTLRVMWVFIINSCRSFNLRVVFFAIWIQISIRLVKYIYIFFCLCRTLIIQHFHSSFQIISLHRYTALIFTPVPFPSPSTTLALSFKISQISCDLITRDNIRLVQEHSAY